MNKDLVQNEAMRFIFKIVFFQKMSHYGFVDTNIECSAEIFVELAWCRKKTKFDVNVIAALLINGNELPVTDGYNAKNHKILVFLPCSTEEDFERTRCPFYNDVQSWTHSGTFSRHSRGIPSAIIDTIFDILSKFVPAWPSSTKKSNKKSRQTTIFILWRCIRYANFSGDCEPVLVSLTKLHSWMKQTPVNNSKKEVGWRKSWNTEARATYYLLGLNCVIWSVTIPNYGNFAICITVFRVANLGYSFHLAAQRSIPILLPWLSKTFTTIKVANVMFLLQRRSHNLSLTRLLAF